MMIKAEGFLCLYITLLFSHPKKHSEKGHVINSTRSRGRTAKSRTNEPRLWSRYSINVGIAARNIADKIENLGGEKAYILGVLHDIDSVPALLISLNIYEGYKYGAIMGALA